MLNRLERLARQGFLRPLDYQFARFIATTVAASDDRETGEVVTLAAALVSHELGLGHVCLPLAQINPGHLFGFGAEQSASLTEGLPALNRWPDLLAASAAVSTGSEATPLVLEQGALVS